jgi:hypothetical protein
MQSKIFFASRLRLRRDADHAVAVSYSRAAHAQHSCRKTAIAFDRAVSRRTRDQSIPTSAPRILQRVAARHSNEIENVGTGSRPCVRHVNQRGETDCNLDKLSIAAGGSAKSIYLFWIKVMLRSKIKGDYVIGTEKGLEGRRPLQCSPSCGFGEVTSVDKVT